VSSHDLLGAVRVEQTVGCGHCGGARIDFGSATTQILYAQCTQIGCWVAHGYWKPRHGRVALLGGGCGAHCGVGGPTHAGRLKVREGSVSLADFASARGQPVFSFLERKGKLGARYAGGNP
jgi:hypothetical protein